MFDSAQKLFFWWFSAVIIRNESIGKSSVGTGTNSRNKPELADVLALITRLANTGKLSDEQLGVFSKYGHKRREPRATVFAEKRDAELWIAAMATLETEFRKLGWVAQ